jgi:hypothetical protein
VGGLFLGRALAPSIDDRVNSVQADARQIAAGLRVLAIHDEAGTVSDATGNGGADLVLKRTRRELDHAFGRAPWLGRAQRDALLRAFDALQRIPDRTSSTFGKSAAALAAQIEATFGVGE